MAWIESHQDLASHPKMLRLAGVLDIPPAQAIGHLHLLWWWCLAYADDGDLNEFSAFEVAKASQWDGDPETFLEALKTVGWVDNGAGGLQVHDWLDYAGKIVSRRRANAKRMRAARAKEKEGS